MFEGEANGEVLLVAAASWRRAAFDSEFASDEDEPAFEGGFMFELLDNGFGRVVRVGVL